MWWIVEDTVGERDVSTVWTMSDVLDVIGDVSDVLSVVGEQDVETV